jgi:hypothetical protein
MPHPQKPQGTPLSLPFLFLAIKTTLASAIKSERKGRQMDYII